MNSKEQLEQIRESLLNEAYRIKDFIELHDFSLKTLIIETDENNCTVHDLIYKFLLDNYIFPDCIIPLLKNDDCDLSQLCDLTYLTDTLIVVTIRDYKMK